MKHTQESGLSTVSVQCEEAVETCEDGSAPVLYPGSCCHQCGTYIIATDL